MEAPAHAAAYEFSSPDEAIALGDTPQPIILSFPGEGAECRGRLAEGTAGLPPAPEMVLQALQEAGVVTGIDAAAVADFCAAAAAGESPEIILAAGTPAVNGANGFVDFCIRTSSNEAHYDEDAAGNVDFHRLHMFDSVVEGQEIGVVREPEPGVPGQTVRGAEIPALPGDPVRFSVGEGVRLEGDTFFATMPGRVVWQDAVVSISDEFEVPGDVDFTVGHIDFTGFVTIKGDVLDDFDISAAKGLRVLGTVGACRLSSVGNIELGGMAGQGRGTISCGGTLTSRYLHDVSVACEGNVIVESELLNSLVKCCGAVIVRGGRISGGDYIALGGIEARQIGSLVGVSTRLVAGADFRDLEALQRHFARMQEISQQMDRTSDRAAVQELFAEKVTITREIRELRNRQHAGALPEVKVLGRLLDNVAITVGATTDNVSDMIGPITIAENPGEGGLSFQPLTVEKP